MPYFKVNDRVKVVRDIFRSGFDFRDKQNHNLYCEAGSLGTVVGVFHTQQSVGKSKVNIQVKLDSTKEIKTFRPTSLIIL